MEKKVPKMSKVTKGVQNKISKIQKRKDVKKEISKGDKIQHKKIEKVSKGTKGGIKQSIKNAKKY